MKIIYILTLIILWLHPCASLAEWSEEDRRQEREQLDLWERRLANMKHKDGSERIEELGLGIRSMAFRRKFSARDPRTDQVYFAIQRAMTAIPGHAEYYRERINRAQDHLKEAWDDVNLAGPAFVSYGNEQMYGFQTLEQLPSVETVRVLGELMFNEWVPEGNESAPPGERLLETSVYSATALTNLPIQSKPVPKGAKFHTPEDVIPWQQWYEEIKSGKRTFRFEGDPTEYDLNGPAPKEKLERIARDRKRDAERMAGIGKPGSSEPSSAEPSAVSEKANKTVSIAASLAALVLLSSLVWYLSKARKRWAK